MNLTSTNLNLNNINCYLKTILQAIAADWSEISKESSPVNQCNSGYQENYSIELGVFEYLADKKPEILVLELHFLVANGHSKITVHANYAYADNGETEGYKTTILNVDTIDSVINITNFLRAVAIYSANKDGDIQYNMADAMKFEKYLSKKMGFFLAPFIKQITLGAEQMGNISLHHNRNFK